MILYCKTTTPRLTYIADFIGREIFGKPIEITSTLANYQNYDGIKINYTDSPIIDTEFRINPHGLLFQDTITTQTIECGNWQNQIIFFETGGDLPFDLFAASFYLLSRYEEYLPHDLDAYGRYDHRNSLAYKQGFLHRPLINFWLQLFVSELKKKFPLFTPSSRSFQFLPTYDIDMAWSYLHKGFWRTLGGLLRSIVKADFKEVSQRIRVIQKKQTDPYDTYAWMNRMHEKYKTKPYYFFLLAASTGKYDKNISPSSPAMEKLIGDHSIRYPIGIHPSWQSGDNQKHLKTEIATLATITGGKIQSSRQHYIRFELPGTFRALLTNGIRFDFSMGYGSINGFRASVASPFAWYDLASEQKTDLTFFPFCFMDANSFYEQKFTPEEALEEMRHYSDVVKSVNGTLSMIWHNSFLGTDKKFAGWKEVYEEFVKEVSNGEKGISPGV
jgi:hypothetical protein